MVLEKVEGVMESKGVDLNDSRIFNPELNQSPLTFVEARLWSLKNISCRPNVSVMVRMLKASISSNNAKPHPARKRYLVLLGLVIDMLSDAIDRTEERNANKTNCQP